MLTTRVIFCSCILFLGCFDLCISPGHAVHHHWTIFDFFEFFSLIYDCALNDTNAKISEHWLAAESTSKLNSSQTVQNVKIDYKQVKLSAESWNYTACPFIIFVNE